MNRNDKSEAKLRIAIVDSEKCKPKDCHQECKENCPVVRMGKLCVVVTKKDTVATISESLCTGCNICTKKCPLGAIKIINLPKASWNTETTHRYGPNTFKLHRLPMPRLNQVLGLVGVNGIGKSTALKILAGACVPNLGNFAQPPGYPEIIKYFRGSDLQNYFTGIANGSLKALVKPQYVDAIARSFKGRVDGVTVTDGSVRTLLDLKNQRDPTAFNQILDWLDLNSLYQEGRDIRVLSGGELQRFALAVVCVQQANIYLFDEPTSYLDIRQRINAAVCIRALAPAKETYVVCVEHDLAILDYLSDNVCCLYGKPGIYGVVTSFYGAHEGINIYLQGFIPTENMRFRDHELSFKMVTRLDEDGNAIDTSTTNTKQKRHRNAIDYPAMTKTMGNFKLHIEPGSFEKSEITVLLGENGTGKSTLIQMLAGIYEPDELDVYGQLSRLPISYKPQKLDPSFCGTVRELLQKKLQNAHLHTQFQTDVFKPLHMDELLDLEVLKLSGGELQRMNIVLCLGKPADIYLIDEPSAFLDSEQRIIAAKIIKRFIMHTRKTAFIVEHDFIMATYLADKVICFDGIPSVKCTANSPATLLAGMNKFLKQLDVTFRRDPVNWRPRINKFGSNKDTEQKLSGNYFFLEDTD